MRDRTTPEIEAEIAAMMREAATAEPVLTESERQRRENGTRALDAARAELAAWEAKRPRAPHTRTQQARRIEAYRERVARLERALGGGRPTGLYYTPAEIVDPSAGAGAFLWDVLIANPAR